MVGLADGRDIIGKTTPVRHSMYQTFLHHQTPTSRHSPLDAPFCSSKFCIIEPHLRQLDSLQKENGSAPTNAATPLGSFH